MGKHSFYHASGTPDMNNHGDRIYAPAGNTGEPPQLPFNIEFTLAHIDDERVRTEFIRSVGSIGFEIGLKLTDRQVITLRENAERRVANQDTRLKMTRKRAAGATSVVYYLRFDGDIVKIGTTTDLARRMASMYRRPQDLLASEPGDIRLEKMRHEQFVDDRAEWEGSREMFHLTPVLLSHIDMLNNHQAKAA